MFLWAMDVSPTNGDIFLCGNDYSSLSRYTSAVNFDLGMVIRLDKDMTLVWYHLFERNYPNTM